MDDFNVARKYTTKHSNARQSGHEFDLTFNQFKVFMNRKTCQYTGVILTECPTNNNGLSYSDRTLERIDNRLGYVEGNVLVVCHAANLLKSVWENKDNPLTLDMVKKMVGKL